MINTFILPIITFFCNHWKINLSAYQLLFGFKKAPLGYSDGTDNFKIKPINKLCMDNSDIPAGSSSSNPNPVLSEADKLAQARDQLDYWQGDLEQLIETLRIYKNKYPDVNARSPEIKEYMLEIETGVVEGRRNVRECIQQVTSLKQQVDNTESFQGGKRNFFGDENLTNRSKK